MIRHKQSLHNSLPPPLFFKEEILKECKKSVKYQWQGLVSSVLCSESKVETIDSPNKFKSLAERLLSTLRGILGVYNFKIILLITESVQTVE